MRRLGQAGERFNEKVQIIDGPATVARVQRADDDVRIGAEFALPKLTLRVRRNSLIQTGQVVRVQGDNLYLVADHSEATDYRTHHLFPTDRQVVWTRAKTRVHPVTKIPETTGQEEIGRLWVMWERTRREFVDLAIRVGQENYLIATGADIQLGDYLDNKQVKRVAHALGVRIVELQG